MPIPIGNRSKLSNPKGNGAITSKFGHAGSDPGMVLPSSAPRPKIDNVKGPAQGPAPAFQKYSGAARPIDPSPVARSAARLKIEQKDRTDRVKHAPKVSKKITKPTGLDWIKSRKVAPRSPSKFRDSVAVTIPPASADGRAGLTTVPLSTVQKLNAQTVSAMIDPPAMPAAVSTVEQANDAAVILLPNTATATFVPVDNPPNPIAAVNEGPPKSNGLGRVLFALVAGVLVFFVVRKEA